MRTRAAVERFALLGVREIFAYSERESRLSASHVCPANCVADTAITNKLAERKQRAQQQFPQQFTRISGVIMHSRGLIVGPCECGRFLMVLLERKSTAVGCGIAKGWPKKFQGCQPGFWFRAAMFTLVSACG